MMGNEACAEGALAAGCTFFAAYPITPASEIAEYVSGRMHERGGTFIQMEDELASICAVMGASMTGAKAMTATSGPGFSLMQEGIGYAYATETPCVVVDVQRIGPSTGSIFSQQADIMQARWGSHGNTYQSVALAPSSVQDMYDLTIESFNIAEQFRIPVMMMAEAAIAHLSETVTIPNRPIIEITSRLRTEEKMVDFPFRAAPDRAPLAIDFGTGRRSYVTAHLHGESGRPILNPRRYPAAETVLKRLASKIEMNIDQICRLETDSLDESEIVVISYGSTARSAAEAVRRAQQEGIRVGHIRLVTVWPFYYEKIRKICHSARAIIVAEVNAGQIIHEVERAIGNSKRVIPCLRYVDMFTPEELLRKIREVARND